MGGEGKHRALFTGKRARGTFTYGAILLFLLVPRVLFGEYPRIEELTPRDILFKQLQNDLQDYFQAESRRLPDSTEPVEFPPLRLFSYRPGEEMDLFSLAARANLPYDCLATLNGFDNPAAMQTGYEVLLPNQPGIFVWDPPATTFQEIVSSVSRNTRSGAESLLIEKDGHLRRVLFFRGESLTSIERAYFLSILFRFPLPFGVLTSGYGMRDNPFTGHSEFHKGIDIAAPFGTEVQAARDGRVSATGYDEVMGNMIILDHEAGYQTIYGHLSQITVSLNQKVRSGMIIGEVGSSGYSTGPHLHFEIRRLGATRDPATLLPLPKEKDQ